MKRNASVKIVLCGIFAAFTCICAMISIPFGPVPINMAHLAIFISAWILGPVLGAVSQLVYIFLGVVGLPVFSNFSAGIGHILGPTGGYIIAYPLVAFFSGLIFKINKINKAVSILLGISVGWIIEYSVGTAYYCQVTSAPLVSALFICVIPFFVGDICKSIVVFVICRKIKIQRILTNKR